METWRNLAQTVSWQCSTHAEQNIMSTFPDAKEDKAAAACEI